MEMEMEPENQRGGGALHPKKRILIIFAVEILADGRRLSINFISYYLATAKKTYPPPKAPETACWGQKSRL